MPASGRLRYERARTRRLTTTPSRPSSARTRETVSGLIRWGLVEPARGRQALLRAEPGGLGPEPFFESLTTAIVVYERQIVRDLIPVTGAARLPALARALRLAAQALVQMWRESVCAHRCLRDVGVRAGACGSLCWEGRPGGWRLAGRFLPAELPGSAESQSGEISRPGSPGA
jgi:hypothetical protein